VNAGAGEGYVSVAPDRHDAHVAGIRYPNMHEELIGLLEDLLSSEDGGDERVAFPAGFNEWSNEVDDLLPEGADGASGAVLFPSEVKPVATFLESRDAIWRDVGSDGTFQQYRQHPGWPSVIDTARKALVAMADASPAG
jgi:hypothetical protein